MDATTVQNNDVKKESIPLIKPYKGVNLRALSHFGLTLGTLVIFLTSYSLYVTVSRYNSVVNTIDIFTESQAYITDLKEASDSMTSNVRTYVFTHNPVYIDKYFENVTERKRELALEHLSRLLTDESYQSSIDKVRLALDESNALMDAEIHAMKLIWLYGNDSLEGLNETVASYPLSANEENYPDSYKLDAAYQLVFGEKYRLDKFAIDTDSLAAIEELSTQLTEEKNIATQDLRHAINNIMFSVIMLFALVIMIFVSVAKLAVMPLKNCVISVEEDRPIEVKGCKEFRIMAETYNSIYEINKANRAQMKFKIEHDTLTNVFSRQAFEEQKNVLTNANNPMAMLMIDVDKFKEINDQYGHEKGDEVLIRIASTLKSSFRSNDIIARIGGDEFAVLMMDMRINDVNLIADKINHINEALKNPGENEIKTSISVGIAFSEIGYKEDMYVKADQALYHTKKNGRGGYSVYHDSDIR